MTMNDDEANLRQMYASLVLDEAKENIVSAAVVQNPNRTFTPKLTLIGRFVTESPIHFESMKEMLSRIWKPVFKVYIVELSRNLFSFQFRHQHDLDRVLADGPWTFNQKLLLLNMLEPGMLPDEVILTHTDMWIQAHGLSPGFFSEYIAKLIGESIGKFICSDENNFKGFHKQFMRIRVSMDVNKPLRRYMKLQLEDGTEALAQFKYEKLPHFCFFCGVIGHSEKFCKKCILFPDKNVQRLFGPWLRATPKRNFLAESSPWLLTEPPEEIEANMNSNSEMLVDAEANNSTVLTTYDQNSNEENELGQGRGPEGLKSTSKKSKINDHSVLTEIDANSGGNKIWNIPPAKRDRNAGGSNSENSSQSRQLSNSSVVAGFGDDQTRLAL